MTHEWEGPTRESKCQRCGLLKGDADMFGMKDCMSVSAMETTRDETLQAERDLAKDALADAVCKARDVALEEAAKLADERRAAAKNLRAQSAEIDDPKVSALAIVVHDERACVAARIADDIRALKPKP